MKTVFKTLGIITIAVVIGFTMSCGDGSGGGSEPNKVATPTANPPAGVVLSGTTVTLSCTTADVSIYYTADGTTPTASSTLYSAAITIDAATTIKAIAIKEGMTDSNILTAAYTIGTPKVATPTASVASGTYTSAQNVILSTTTLGASIYYTLDGSMPTSSSTLYSTAIAINITTTLKAIAILSDYNDSDVLERTYTINTGHSGCRHNWIMNTGTAPTCTVQGYGTAHCTTCSTTISVAEVLPALGHIEPGIWQIKNAPTVTANGVDQRICSHTGCSHEFETRTNYATGTAGLVYFFENTRWSIQESPIPLSGSIHIPAFRRADINSPYYPVYVVFAGAFGDTSITANPNITEVTFAAESQLDIIGGAFRNLTSLANITLPASVTSIREYSFEKCTSLTSIIIPANVQDIGGHAFTGCTNLTSVTFESSTVSSIGSSWEAAFDGDLEDKYLAGGAGTYTRTAGGNVWTKQ